MGIHKPQNSAAEHKNTEHLAGKVHQEETGEKSIKTSVTLQRYSEGEPTSASHSG